MSNSEPSAIVLQDVFFIGGLYISFDSNLESGSLKLRPQLTGRHSTNQSPLNMEYLSILGLPNDYLMTATMS